jgi:hypothetical protein
LGATIKPHAAFSLRLKKAMQEAGREVENRSAQRSEDLRSDVPPVGGTAQCIERPASATWRARVAVALSSCPAIGADAPGGTDRAAKLSAASLPHAGSRVAERAARNMHAAWRRFYLVQAEALAAQLAREKLSTSKSGAPAYAVTSIHDKQDNGST